jgi:signal transduction histidine kinase
MKNNNSLWVAILGDREKVSTDRYFLTMTCFITSIFLFFLTIFNLLEHFKLAPVILAGCSCLLVLGIYFLLRFAKFLFYPKLMLTVIGLLFLDMTWYYKFLSNGPILFFILVFAALVLWVWEGKWLVIMLCFYFLNIAVLFVIEKNAPDFLFMYPASSLRSTDIYLGFSFYSILMITLLYTVKKQFERQKDKAIESDKLKTAFLGNMSHEIRTPMNHIVGFSELLENEEDKVKRREYVKIIQNSGASLLKLINDLIDLSKIEAGDMTISNSNFSLNEMFDELKEIYSFELIRKGKYHVQLHYELPANELIIYSDKLRLKQVLSNLLNNAMKFTDSGTITFGCFKEGHELNFSVADTGAGIPEKDQKKIFERFAKFDYKGMNPEGTGIGLSIVDK